MSNKLEKQVRDPVVKWAKANNIAHFRNHMGNGVRRGRPDDEFVGKNGRIAWVEFKAPGKVPTPLQQHNLEQLWERGHRAYWTSDSAAAISFLSEALLP